MRRHYILGISVALALTGCDQAPIITAPRPILPAAPADFGNPVKVSAPKIGEDDRAYAARERAARLTANHRLANDAAFYGDVVDRFGASAK